MDNKGMTPEEAINKIKEMEFDSDFFKSTNDTTDLDFSLLWVFAMLFAFGCKNNESHWLDGYSSLKEILENQKENP